MNAIPKAQITHESETQRQYPRFSLPSRAVLNGVEHEIKNLSTGGAAISNVEGAFTRGKQIALHLKFPFSAFSLGIPLTAEIQYYDAVNKILGCQFTDQDPEQVSFLNHAIKSFIAGDIVTADNILNIAQRNNFTNARPPANNNAAASSLRRQLPGLLLVLVIGVLIATLIVGNLYSSMFVVRADDGTVMGPAITVHATTEGIFHSKLDAGLSLVQQDQVIGTVTPVSGGEAVTLKSPCSCYIAKTHIVTGDLVLQDQQILSLVPVDAKPWIIAEMDPSQAKKIGPDSLANVSIFGSRDTYTGHVTSMESSLSDIRGANGNKDVLMKITPDQKLPVDFVNRLAAVTFDIR